MFTTLPDLPETGAQTSSGGPGVSLLVQAIIALGVTTFGSVSWYSVSPFLADATTGETVGAGAIIAALAVGATKLFDYLVKLRKDRYDDEDRRENRRVERDKADQLHKAQEKAAEIQHLEKALDRETAERRRLNDELAADRRQHVADMNDLRREFMRAEIKASRAVTWIKSMEGLLRARKIEYIPFDETDDSDDQHVRMHGPTPPPG